VKESTTDTAAGSRIVAISPGVGKLMYLVWRGLLGVALVCALQGCAQLPKADAADTRPLLGALYPTRWFPRSVRFSPDESNLLVSLCHFQYGHYCRVARYWIADARWEVLAAEIGVSMAWPDYSPDGRNIVYAQASCAQTYHCIGAEFELMTMTHEGTQRRSVGQQVGVQMPTYSPDGSRVLYWRVQGSGTPRSGRSIPYWSLYEVDLSSQPGSTVRQLTDDLYFGIYGAPRYLPDGERLLYTAYRGDGASNDTFMIRRDEGMRRNVTLSRGPIPAWTDVKTQFIHAYHPKWGWLVGFSKLWFQPATEYQTKRQILNSAPYSTPVADVSRGGDWVAALSGVPSGTMRDADSSMANYWAESPSGTQGPARTPVMTITRVESGQIRPITNWPADVEKVFGNRECPAVATKRAQSKLHNEEREEIMADACQAT
jgi:hypothetical protein